MSISDSTQEILEYRDKIARGEYVSSMEKPVCFWGKYFIKQRGCGFSTQNFHTREEAEQSLIWWNAHRYGGTEYYIYVDEND
jgi:hypothetical protein